MENRIQKLERIVARFEEDSKVNNEIIENILNQLEVLQKQMNGTAVEVIEIGEQEQDFQGKESIFYVHDNAI